ncbi:hypothetical protein LUW75_14915 [Streptomyces sp. MRC013]|uniref:hypothetical protein n=1 Tax=Streptomyces sp. MRC013 TaxID=2898276 RepID=UPI002025BA35|nr:hypothetical protein [Streptomyces sp. MRC013]URM91065.1 hypothetical protein LUW75_14915 [Streptomyces sp. MRC013]
MSRWGGGRPVPDGGREGGGRPVPDGEGRPVLTLRVSRDGGRTWGERTVVRSREKLAPPHSSVWPPCRCPKCRPAGHP